MGDDIPEGESEKESFLCVKFSKIMKMFATSVNLSVIHDKKNFYI